MLLEERRKKVHVNWLASLTKNVLVPALEDEVKSVDNSRKAMEFKQKGGA